MTGGLAAAAAGGPGLLDAVWLGLVEGLTEFLPVSSTGHLIVTGRLLGLPADAANDLFTVAIQLGAISAVLVRYRRRLLDATRSLLVRVPGERNLLWQIAVAALPAVAVGLAADDWIHANLFSARVVAAAMAIGGVLLLLLERMLRGRDGGRELATMSYATAFGIGLFQCLAMVPGTSRSAATIAGAMVLGLSRTAAAEFSFLVGLPILYGAALYELVGKRELLVADAVAPLLVGGAVSFVGAMLVIGPFVRFLQRHTFAPFAWYRLAAGAGLGALCWVGYVAD